MRSNLGNQFCNLVVQPRGIGHIVDQIELQGFLGDESRVPGVTATPGRGTHVPLYILGSSLFGARLAAVLGLPYAFASHFAPAALTDAVALYRKEFRPSAQLDAPYVIAGVGVIASTSQDDAEAQLLEAQRRRVKFLVGKQRRLTDDEVDLLLDSPAGDQVRQMTRYAAVGTPDVVREQLERFAAHADADELILASSARDRHARLRTFELVAAAGATLTTAAP